MSPVELERILAANCLLYHLNFMSLGGIHISMQIPPFPLTNSYPVPLLACSMAHFNRIFPELIELKFRLVEHQDGPTLDTERRIYDLKSKLDKASFGFLTKLHRQLGSKYLEVPHLINIFSFYHAYYAFFITGMRLYRSNNTLSPLPLSPPCSKTLNAALYHCSLALQWGMKTLNHHFHWHTLAKFGQCLIFFTLHRGILSPDDHALLRQGIVHLKSLSNNPHSGAIFYYIQFINKLALFFPEKALA
ncbi:hypothetical protein DSO57_1001095 [Entomophthora muscae]|uniref:Uncharacterized protein n=1 Tax=Entomophthora muscae TaxID=34485 RepID=A0ACC2SBK5_9FUNG|nr:hypothetical protein DSO57_1001095 [Entomophthora muscae]